VRIAISAAPFDGERDGFDPFLPSTTQPPKTGSRRSESGDRGQT
jgi:hypothetical protein